MVSLGLPRALQVWIDQGVLVLLATQLDAASGANVKPCRSVPQEHSGLLRCSVMPLWVCPATPVVNRRNQKNIRARSDLKGMWQAQSQWHNGTKAEPCSSVRRQSEASIFSALTSQLPSASKVHGAVI